MKQLNFLFLILFFGFGPKVFAQGSICATAEEVLPGVYNANGPSTGGGLDVSACLTGGPFTGNADWYTFTPSVSGFAQITPENLFNQDLYVFSGTCGALVCETQSTTGQATTFFVNAGTQYFIEWGDNFSSAAFSWSLGFANNASFCNNAFNLSVAPIGLQNNITVGSTIWTQSSQYALSPSCVFSNGGTENVTDVFYRFFTPPGATSVDILVNSISNGAAGIIQFAVWDGCGGTELFCDNTVNSTGPITVAGLNGGTEYILQVLSAESEQADFEIGLEAIGACNAGNINTSWASEAINYCPGDSVNLSTDGTEDYSPGDIYQWYLFETTSSQEYYVLGSNNGSSYFGTLDSAFYSGTLEIAPLPTGTYRVTGAFIDTANVEANSCITFNEGFINILEPNDSLCTTPTNIRELSLEEFKVYPNPSTGVFRVEVKTNKSTDVQIQVLDLLGRVIYQDALEGVSGKVLKQISLPNTSQGMYMLELSDGKMKAIKKLTIQ